MSTPRPLPPNGLPFTHAPALAAPFYIPASAFLASRPLLRGAATGALVFSSHPSLDGQEEEQDRVLLIQRAAHDSMPLRWEIPGGACDPTDETVLHGLARELWEEAGLRLKRVVRQVGGEQVFLTRRGLAVGKVTFEVEVEASSDAGLPEVELDPNEHVRFVWATEEECEAGRVAVLGSDAQQQEVVDIQFTTKDQRDVVLLGFKLRREGEQGGEGDKTSHFGP